MFLQSLVKLKQFYFSAEFCPQIQLKIKKKSLLHSGSISVWTFKFFVVKWVLLAKKPRRPDIIRLLQCQTPWGHDPPIGDAYGLDYQLFMKQMNLKRPYSYD